MRAGYAVIVHTFWLGISNKCLGNRTTYLVLHRYTTIPPNGAIMHSAHKEIKAVLAGNRLVLEIETKEQLHAMRMFIDARPEIEKISWIQINSIADTHCEITPINKDDGKK